jgi:hypothetical protein
MVKALEWAVAERDNAWTLDRELRASNVEVLHSFLLTYLKSHGAKNVGKPVHYERPWEKQRQREQMVSPRAFALMTGAANV